MNYLTINKMPSIWDWSEFQRDIHSLFDRSECLGDSWEVIACPNADSSEECSEYLRKITKCLANVPSHSQEVPNPLLDDQCWLPDEDPSSINLTDTNNYTLLLYEFHVLFHPSYRVPSLYFNATKPDGTHLTLDEAWQLLTDRGIATGSKLATVITEMHHPVLGTPFLALHPCRTADLLEALPFSKNRVITFLSTLGPAVNLQMDVRYGQKMQ